MGIRNSRRSKSVKSVGEDANLRDLKLPTTNFIRKIKLVLRVYRIGLVPPALPIFHAQLSSKLSPSPRRANWFALRPFPVRFRIFRADDWYKHTRIRIYILINISGKRGGNLQFKCNWWKFDETILMINISFSLYEKLHKITERLRIHSEDNARGSRISLLLFKLSINYVINFDNWIAISFLDQKVTSSLNNIRELYTFSENKSLTSNDSLNSPILHVSIRNTIFIKFNSICFFLRIIVPRDKTAMRL